MGIYRRWFESIFSREFSDVEVWNFPHEVFNQTRTGMEAPKLFFVGNWRTEGIAGIKFVFRSMEVLERISQEWTNESSKSVHAGKKNSLYFKTYTWRYSLKYWKALGS